MSTPKERRPKPPMDGLTAIAFVREAFEQLHPVPLCQGSCRIPLAA